MDININRHAKHYLIYKSNSGVCLSVCGDKQGKAGAGQGRAARVAILKQTWWCLSVWTKIGQCLEDSSSHCPVELMTNRAGAGQGGQGSRCGGSCKVPFLLKKSLGKTGGPASNQTKIQFS